MKEKRPSLSRILVSIELCIDPPLSEMCPTQTVVGGMHRARSQHITFPVASHASAESSIASLCL